MYASDRKDVIETSLAIIERIDFLIRPFASAKQVLKVLYSLLSSEAFAIVGDLETLARKIFMILDEHQKELQTRSCILWHISATSFTSIPGLELGKRCNASILERLQSSSENMSSNLSIYDADSHKMLSLSNRSHRRAALFSPTSSSQWCYFSLADVMRVSCMSGHDILSRMRSGQCVFPDWCDGHTYGHVKDPADW